MQETIVGNSSSLREFPWPLHWVRLLPSLQGADAHINKVPRLLLEPSGEFQCFQEETACWPITRGPYVQFGTYLVSEPKLELLKLNKEENKRSEKKETSRGNRFYVGARL